MESFYGSVRLRAQRSIALRGRTRGRDIEARINYYACVLRAASCLPAAPGLRSWVSCDLRAATCECDLRVDLAVVALAALGRRRPPRVTRRPMCGHMMIVLVQCDALEPRK